MNSKQRIQILIENIPFQFGYCEFINKFAVQKRREDPRLTEDNSLKLLILYFQVIKVCSKLNLCPTQNFNKFNSHDQELT